MSFSSPDVPIAATFKPSLQLHARVWISFDIVALSTDGTYKGGVLVVKNFGKKLRVKYGGRS